MGFEDLWENVDLSKFEGIDYVENIAKHFYRAGLLHAAEQDGDLSWRSTGKDVSRTLKFSHDMHRKAAEEL